MGIKTEDFVYGIPPKDMPADALSIDWVGILDSFDPKKIEQRFLNECARRNPYETCYRWDTPRTPVEERLHHAEFCVGSYRKELVDCVNRIFDEGLTETRYKNARNALIAAIGIKGAAEYVRQEYEQLGDDGRKKQAEEYSLWCKDVKEAREREEKEYREALESGEYFFGQGEGYASVHEKVVRVRKGWKCSNGKPLTQREFAKLLNYPINKYAEAEKVDKYGRDEEETEVEAELLEKLVMIAHANPYWLFDAQCLADWAEDSFDADIVMMGDAPCVFAAPDTILSWINSGKPRVTHWEEEN